MISTPKISSRRVARQRGFTLVEILASLAVGCLLLLSVALIAVMSAKVMRKNVLAGDAVTASRLFQEHLNREITMAVSTLTPYDLSPKYTGPNAAAPPLTRYSRLTYRIITGPSARVASDAPLGQSDINLTCPAGLTRRSVITPCSRCPTLARAHKSPA